MRILLVLMLVHGLAPGLAEVGEAIVHWARTGPAAHSAEDRGDPGPEHGCGSTQHRCACCPAQVFTPAAEVAVASLDRAAPKPLLEREVALATREPARPFRPPIS